MPVKYEWKRTKGGKRYVRSVIPDEPGPAPEPEPVAPVEVPVEAVAEAEYVPEIKIEPAEEAPKPKRGRPRKVAEVEADE